MSNDLDTEDMIYLLYLSKQLQKIGKMDIIEPYLNVEIDYDIYFEIATTVISDIFEHIKVSYYEQYELEVDVFSDQLIVDYYQLAYEYGKRHNIIESENPYFIAVKREANDNLSFSYSIDWRIQAHPQSKRPFRSRFAIFLYFDCEIDFFGLAIGTARMYQFFQDKCKELNKVLSVKEGVAA